MGSVVGPSPGASGPPPPDADKKKHRPKEFKTKPDYSIKVGELKQ